MTTDTVAVLLWDCDGVLQHGRFDWRERLDTAVAPGFARKVFEAELPALRGERSLRAVLTDLLEQEKRSRSWTRSGASGSAACSRRTSRTTGCA
ncbi:hypothetical protein [Janibacter cremeus]|uniref:Uncharacterized protein n=1 Tax=Janibacter cremeus TaxID=1285192 RepID=A0A852VR78_9MICO|nr:hypothetical protein [Janibacter cremeus]NYF99527.1 hypothetical protein [Janibacter cremeus]